MQDDLLRLRATQYATKLWWVFLITGAIWLMISLIVFRFDATSATAIGILIGVIAIVLGVLELGQASLLEGGWKVLSIVLGAIFLVAGFAALVYPEKTFLAVASILAWILLFKGAYDIVIALATKDDIDLWWLRFIVGILEIGLAFWAAGGFARSATLLVAFVGVLTLFRGITDFFTAFQLRGLGKDLDEGGPPAAPAGRRIESPY